MAHRSRPQSVAIRSWRRSCGRWCWRPWQCARAVHARHPAGARGRRRRCWPGRRVNPPLRAGPWASVRLGWRPRLPLRDAVSSTVDWYRRALAGASADEMFDLSLRQIAAWEGTRS